MSELTNKALDYLLAGRSAEALQLAEAALRDNPHDWHALYVRGSVARALGDLQSAVELLRRSDELHTDEPSVLLALAIAQQKQGSYEAAMNTLKRLLTVDPEHVLGFNTLGMTQKLMGEPDKACHNYHAGVVVLVRAWVRGLKNRATAPRKLNWNSRHNLWIEFAMLGAIARAIDEGREQIAVINDEQVDHGDGRPTGWYWQDTEDAAATPTRMLCPNFFSSCAAYLKSDGRYAHLIGNRSTVLAMLGRKEEARQHLQEAEDFDQP